MSSRDNDDFDFFDTGHHEERTPDSWTAFYSGILIGLVGGALATLAPWLSGVLILVGYGLTALTLKSTGSRFIRALRFGFGVAALAGAIMLACEILYPTAAWRFIEMAGERSLIFVSVAVTPWMLGLIRYVYVMARGQKRKTAQGAA
jgi:hypothetical protein